MLEPIFLIPAVFIGVVDLFLCVTRIRWKWHGLLQAAGVLYGVIYYFYISFFDTKNYSLLYHPWILAFAMGYFFWQYDGYKEARLQRLTSTDSIQQTGEANEIPDD